MIGGLHPGLTEPLNTNGVVADEIQDADEHCSPYIRGEIFLMMMTFSISASMYVIAIPGGETFAATTLTLIVGGFGFANALRVIYMWLKYALVDGSDVIDSIVKIRKQRNELENTVSLLSQTVNQLHADADRMKQSEYDLKVIVSQQGVSLDDVIELAIENKLALGQQKMNLRLTTVYSVAQTFFHKDVNVSPEMLSILIYQLQCKLRIHGIIVNHDVLKALINKTGLHGLVKFCGEFLLSGFDNGIQEGSELKAFALQREFHFGFMIGQHEDEVMLANKTSRKMREELVLRLSENNMIRGAFFPKEITLYY